MACKLVDVVPLRSAGSDSSARGSTQLSFNTPLLDAAAAAAAPAAAAAAAAAADLAAISSYRLVGIPVGGGANITVSGAGQPGSGNQVRSTCCQRVFNPQWAPTARQASGAFSTHTD